MEENKKQADLYDEEFYTNLKLARGLIAQIPTDNDRDICKKWILKLCNLKSNDAVVKRNRNHFFRYLLQIMHKGTIGTKHLEHQEGFLQYDKKMTEGTEGAPQKFMCRWSPDKRTYVAAKPLPGQGALVYMAVARDPLLGWDHSATPS